MRKILFMMLCCVTVLLEGCNTIEKEFLLAKEENTVEAYKWFASKYATTEYAKEARFRAAMVEGTMEAWLDYLQYDPHHQPAYMTTTVCDSVMAILEKAPVEERWAVYDKTSCIQLKERIKESIFQIDEASAWIMIEQASNSQQKKQLCHKYIKLYPNGDHRYEVEDWLLFMNEIESKRKSRSYVSDRDKEQYEQELARREVEWRLSRKPKLDVSELNPGQGIKKPVRTKPSVSDIGREMARSHQRQLEIMEDSVILVQDTFNN